MQLGTRWDVGATPPGSLPEAVVVAIGRVETELEADGIDTAMWRWTLTWLEGRPIVELDDGTRVLVDGDGAVIVPPSDDEYH